MKIIQPKDVTEYAEYATGEASYPDDSNAVVTCRAETESGYACTRAIGHRHAHVACGVEVGSVAAVWPKG